MKQIQKYILLEEVFVHCNFALVNFAEFKELIRNKYSSKYKGIWLSLQIALTNTSIVSSYIFSTKDSAKDRTNYLQKALLVNPNSALKNTIARNYFMHIDEKFDYCLNNKDFFSGVLEIVVPNRQRFELVDKPSYFIRRAVIKNEMVFIFQLGKKRYEIELNPIISELETILINSSIHIQKTKPIKGLYSFS